MGKTLKILALVALAALLVSTATGCCPLLNSASDEAAEQVSEEIIEGATGGAVDIDEDGGSVTIETEEGAVTIEGGDTPELYVSKAYRPPRRLAIRHAGLRRDDHRLELLLDS